MSIILIQLEGDRLRVGHALARAHEARLPPGALAAAAEEIREMLRPSPGFAVPGRDAARTAAEERAGRRLGALLGEAPGARERLAAQLGEARGRGESPVIAVDCPDPLARSLPWELLAVDQAPLEALGEAVIARLAPGPRPAPLPPRAAPRLEAWLPDPDDPVCAARLGALGEAARARGVAAPTAITPEDAADPGDAPLLFLICHGAADAAGVELLVSGAAPSAGTVGHLLAPRLRRCLAVILEVCEGGGAAEAELDSVGSRLVCAGARAALAARARLSVEAAAALSEGVLDGLVAGEALSAAVARGRRRIRQLSSPRPDARWHTLSLWVSSLDALEATLGPAAPRGWRAAPDAAAWIQEAVALAEDAGRGFLGVEHLLLSVPATRGLLAMARHALEARRGALLDGISGLQRQGRVEALQLSPRLAALRDALPEGFDAGQLWEALAGAPGVLSLLDLGAVAPAQSFGGATLEQAPPWEQPPGAALEVLGGPEDGRVLRPAPGAWIGRYHAENPQGLYGPPGAVDPYLSRRHLLWEGPGAARLSRAARLRRPGEAEREVTGLVELRGGDVLALSPSTRLLARAGEGA